MTTTIARSADFLALSAERDLSLRRLLAAERAAYDRGHRDGYRCGYAEGDAWLAGWLACFSHFADMLGGRIAPERPTQLEILRWGPGGRARFGDPRPGDYPGQGGDAA